MVRFKVELEPDDWQWLCELLNETLKLGELDQHSREDTERMLRLLEVAERAE